MSLVKCVSQERLMEMQCGRRQQSDVPKKSQLPDRLR
jgi:hypothetical protein